MKIGRHCDASQLAERRGLFHGHVCYRDRVDTNARAFCIELVNTTVEHRVGVHQQTNRNGRVLLADRRQHFKALGWGHACRKGAQGGVLDGRAIRQRIGERNTQLQRVGAGFNQGVDNLQRLLRAGVAQRNEGDERAFGGISVQQIRYRSVPSDFPRAFKIS